jgi:hypothetical protein
LLREHLGRWPCKGNCATSVNQIMRDTKRSVLFVLDLRYPHPVLTNSIVFRLKNKEEFEKEWSESNE